MRGSVGALVALCLGVCTTVAHAATPSQGYQSDSAFAASYAAHGVTSVLATAQRVSCYAPEVVATFGLTPQLGYPDGGWTRCPGATTGENTGPYPTQNVANPALLVKDHSESDIHVDPTDPKHLIGVSKWFVNGEGYNHLAGFYESFDGGSTWPQQGHIPGYEGWTDNSDPVGAFDPWGNFYAFVLAYMFEYDSSGNHILASPRVNPSLPRWVMGIAVRPRDSTSANDWLTTHGGQPDYVATTPFNGESIFDKQWMAIDTNPKSKHFGRIYLSWAIGDGALRIYSSHADAHPDGTHTDWTRPTLVLQQAQGSGDNGSLPHVAPDGTVWLETASFHDDAGPFTASLTSSRNGGVTWSPRRLIARHLQSGYDNTTFRAAFGESFGVGPRRVGKHYPLYLAYENGPNGPVRIYLTASYDNGQHWRRPIIVNDSRGGGEAFQPALVVAPNGTVVVSFYDRRLPCPASGSADAAGGGLAFDPLLPFDEGNFCINTAVQFYRPGLRPIGHNIRVSAHTWDPQLSAPRFICFCNGRATFIGDYFGIDARGGFAYTSSVTTYNENGQNPLFHQQQLVSKLRVP